MFMTASIEKLREAIREKNYTELFKRKEVYIGIVMAAVILTAAFSPQYLRLILGVAEEENGMPEYEGRPVREYREDPNEVRLFTQEQRDVLRQRLSDHAGSIDVNPDSLDPWLQAGVIKKVIGDFEGARDAWEYASLIRPRNFVSFKNLGELYWHYLPDYPRAEVNLFRAIENEPAFVDSYISLSDMYRYSWKEKADLADDILLQGIEKNPESTDLMRHLGRYYKETGERDRAIEYYRKILEIKPDDELVRDELRTLGAGE